MLEDNLKQNCKEVHGKAKLVKGQKTLTFSTTPGQKREKGRYDTKRNIKAEF